MLESISATATSHGIRHQWTCQRISRTQAVGNTSICVIVRISCAHQMKQSRVILTKILCRKYTSADQRICFTADGRLKSIASESWYLFLDHNRPLVQRFVKFDSSINARLVSFWMRNYFDEWHQVWWIEWVSDEDSTRVVCALSNELRAR